MYVIFVEFVIYNAKRLYVIRSNIRMYEIEQFNYSGLLNK